MAASSNCKLGFEVRISGTPDQVVCYVRKSFVWSESVHEEWYDVLAIPHGRFHTAFMALTWPYYGLLVVLVNFVVLGVENT